MKLIGKIINKFKNNYKTIIQIEIDSRYADKLQEKEYEINFNDIKSQRSIEQNKFLWDIIGEISKVQHEDDMKIYCDLLEKANCEYDWLMGLDEIEESLMKSYRVVRKTRYEEHNGKKLAVYKCFKGSSKFGVKEMNQLIDEALRIAWDLGIEIYEDIY